MIKNKQIITIDKKHDEMLKYFDDNEKIIIPQLQEKKNNLIKEIKSLSSNDIDKYMEIKDEIIEIKDNIKKLKREKKKYFVDNSMHIFKYFEDKKNISTGDNSQNMNVLNSFFKIKSKNDSSSDVNNDKYQNSRHLYLNYWKNVNNEILNIKDFIVPSDICEFCSSGELIAQDEEGILICNNPNCGRFITNIII